jgi:hypothetical protein
MVSVPAILVDVAEDEDPDEAEYLRDNFTPTRNSKRRSTQKSFRYDFRYLRWGCWVVLSPRCCEQGTNVVQEISRALAAHESAAASDDAVAVVPCN